MTALFIPPELPEINSPTILRPKDCKSVIQSYTQWVKEEICRRAGNEYVGIFFQLVRSIEKLKAEPLQQRVSTIATGRNINLYKFQTTTLELLSVLKEDFLPLVELIADANFIYAETADVVLRKIRDYPPPSSLETTMKKALSAALGISAFEEVEKGYYIAFEHFTNWLLSVFEILNNAPRNDLRRCQNVAMESIGGKQIVSICRILLIRLANWLESQTGAVFDNAGGFSVLPLLALHPDAREIFGEMKQEIKLSASLISPIINSTFNNVETVSATFTNFGAFAIIVGNYEWASKALSIAKNYATFEQLDVIQKNLNLIARLTAQAETN